jgi:branched-chain amino acid transport system substrate-binding protein
MKYLKVAFSCAVLGLSLGAVAQTTTATIGALLPLTGEFASQGGAFLEGAQLAALEANAMQNKFTYLIAGEDTQYLATPAIIATEKLTRNKSLIGMVISTQHEARPVTPILERKKIPHVILWDSGDDIDAAGEYVFGIGPDTKASGKAAAHFVARTLKAKKAATLNTIDWWSQAVTESFKKSFVETGGRIVSSFEAQPTEADYRSMLAKIISHHPDVIYAPIDNNILSLFEQIKTLNLTIPIVTSDIITANLLINTKGPLEGVYQTQPHLARTPSLEYLEKHCVKFCDQLLFVAWGYDGARAVIESHKAHPASVVDGLREVRFQGATNVINFTKGGSCPSPLAIYQVQHGKLVEVQ